MTRNERRIYHPRSNDFERRSAMARRTCRPPVTTYQRLAPVRPTCSGCQAPLGFRCSGVGRYNDRTQIA